MAQDYSIYDYGWMISHRARMDPIRQALEQCIQPETVVVDIGTGTGIFALMACQLGARKVYAIEPSNAILIGVEMAAVNGYADRIKFIQALSSDIELPEQGQVIISELRGVLPFFEMIIPSLVEARSRLLKPGGVMIPGKDTLWGAVANAPEWYEKLINPWEGNDYGLNLTASRHYLTNSWQKYHAQPEQLLVEPQSWGSIDYYTVVETDIQTELTWTATRAGTAHGLVLWFDTELVPGIYFSNAPGKPTLGYGNAFFPWSEAVDLVPGDEIKVFLAANLVRDDYIWRWETRIRSGNGRPKAEFKQSNFYSYLESSDKLLRQASEHVPTLSPKGEIDRFILELMDGENSLREIAQRLITAYPQEMHSVNEALTRAGDLSVKYDRPLDRKYLREP
jgi:type I protein arginine methyltransferase